MQLMEKYVSPDQFPSFLLTKGLKWMKGDILILAVAIPFVFVQSW